MVSQLYPVSRLPPARHMVAIPRCVGVMSSMTLAPKMKGEMGLVPLDESIETVTSFLPSFVPLDDVTVIVAVAVFVGSAWLVATTW